MNEPFVFTEPFVLTDKPKEWFSAQEAADYLSLPTKQALYVALRREKIPVYRLGKRLRFLRSDLDALFIPDTDYHNSD